MSGPNYRTPGATRVLPVNAPRDQWLAARKRGLGGSDTSTVLGINPWKTRVELWLDKTGRISGEVESNEAMYWGSAHEQTMRRRFTEDTGLAIRQSGLLRSRDLPFMQYTPDGLTEDGGLLELKTAGDYTAPDWDEGPADHALLQVQKGLRVTGRSHAHVCVLINGRDWRTHVVEPDSELQNLIADEEQQFWEKHVLGDVQPAVVAADVETMKRRFPRAIPDSPITLGDDAELWDVLRRRAAAQKQQKSWEEQVKALDAQVRDIIGDHDAVLFGEKTAVKLMNDGTFSSSKFKAEHPELWDELQVATFALDVDRLKTEHPDIYRQYRARVLRVLKPAPINSQED